ncbi:MAG: hypothetical protein KIT67_26115 [Alphaproteobacteria bacterium]|nr:hypothetical protein [Alphaproteobacteria bacterium]
MMRRAAMLGLVGLLAGCGRKSDPLPPSGPATPRRTYPPPERTGSLFPSPREGGEKVPEGRMRGFAASEQRRLASLREEAPHPPRWRSAPSPRLRGEKENQTGTIL